LAKTAEHRPLACGVPERGTPCWPAAIDGLQRSGIPGHTSHDPARAPASRPPPLHHPTRAVYWEPPKPLATGADAKIPHERAPTWA